MCKDFKECIEHGLVGIKNLTSKMEETIDLKECPICGQYFVVVATYKPKFDIAMYGLPENSVTLAEEVVAYDGFKSFPAYSIRPGYGVVPLTV